MEQVGLALCGLELLASCVCKPVRRTGGWAPREWRKRSRGGTVLLALDAELGFQRNCARTRVQDSRLKRRNLGMSLFPENVGVKENRKILLCKTSGGSTEICEIKNKNTARGEDSNFTGEVGPGF